MARSHFIALNPSHARFRKSVSYTVCWGKVSFLCRTPEKWGYGTSNYKTWEYAYFSYLLPFPKNLGSLLV